jgi:hypothetical protein
MNGIYRCLSASTPYSLKPHHKNGEPDVTEDEDVTYTWLESGPAQLLTDFALPSS